MTFCFSTFLYIHYLAGTSLEAFPFFMIALRWRTTAADFSFLYDPPGLGLGFGVQLTILSLSFSFKFTFTNTYHP